jgi:hypothetical protein
MYYNPLAQRSAVSPTIEEESEMQSTAEWRPPGWTSPEGDVEGTSHSDTDASQKISSDSPRRLTMSEGELMEEIPIPIPPDSPSRASNVDDGDEDDNDTPV